MLQQELKLINTNLYLFNQLLSILKEVENEEVAAIERKNAEAGLLVNQSFERIGTILMVFFLLMAIMVFLIMVDISKSNYYRQQLVNAKNKAEELGKVKQRFLANMSHEIRTPLQSIIGYAEQLHHPLHREEASAAIQTSSEHLLQIVNEILDFSRIDTDTFKLEQQPFALQQVVEEVANAMLIQARRKQLSFSVCYPADGDVYVKGDAFRVRQVLYNLLGNAIKFTHSGGVKLEVQLKRDLYVKCTFIISDTGIGILPKDRDRIFGQFEQGRVHNAHVYGGSGLGLSIVKKLVTLHQGSIHVQSETGKGSTFIVELNFERAHAPGMVAATEARNTTETPNNIRVLMVDDDPLILRLGTLLLEKNKIDFRAIGQAEQAMLADVENFNFIFLDIRMPGISGLELCQSYRRRNPKAKIIALTAHVIPQEQTTILDSGFDQILSKPFREHQLLQLLGMHSAAPTLDNFNFAALQEMTLGDEQLFNEILDQFVTDTKRNLTEIKIFCDSNDAVALRETVHQLAGRTAQVGIDKISTSLKLIETALVDDKDISEVKDALDACTLALQQLLSTIEKQKEIS